MKLLPGIFILALIAALTFTGTLLVDQGQAIDQLTYEKAALQDHNQRLIKSMDRAATLQANAQAMATNTDVDNEQLTKAINEAQDWLDHADMALEELQNGVDASEHIPYVTRDIREAVSEAGITLGQAYIRQMIVDECKLYDIDPDLVIAMAKCESGFDPYAIGEAGDIGLLQVLPSTAEWIAPELGYEDYDLFDVETNIRFGVYYLWAVTSDTAKYAPGDELKAGVMAYNMGPYDARDWLLSGKTPDQWEYVQRVMSVYHELKGA